jgi:hypothetical protein
MTSTETGALDADERSRIAALLMRYPDLPDNELDRIHQWFRRGASALDLGLLASDPKVAPHYRAYRADYYDRIKPVDWMRAAIFLGIAIGIIVLIALLMP